MRFNNFTGWITLNFDMISWKRTGCILLLSIASLSTVLLYAAPRNHWPWIVEKSRHKKNQAERIQALGPIYEKFSADEKGTESWEAMRPFALNVTNVEGVEENENHYFLYPLYSHKKTRYTKRWNIFQLVRSLKVEGKQGELKQFTVFPFWFSKETADPETSYKGFFPIHGMVRSLLGYDVFSWTLFPFYGKLIFCQRSVSTGLGIVPV